MTIGSSCVGSTSLKSSFMKTIVGLLGQEMAEVEFTDWISRRCFFRLELEHPLHAKPPTILLITSIPLWRDGSSSLEVHSFVIVSLVFDHYHDVGEDSTPFIHPFWNILPMLGRSIWASVISLYKFAQVSNLNELFNPIFQCLTLFIRVSEIVMVSALPISVGMFRIMQLSERRN